MRKLILILGICMFMNSHLHAVKTSYKVKQPNSAATIGSACGQGMSNAIADYYQRQRDLQQYQQMLAIQRQNELAQYRQMLNIQREFSIQREYEECERLAQIRKQKNMTSNP